MDQTNPEIEAKTPTQKSKSKIILIGVISLVILLLIATGFYFLRSKKTIKSTGNTTTATTTTEPSKTEETKTEEPKTVKTAEIKTEISEINLDEFKTTASELKNTFGKFNF